MSFKRGDRVVLKKVVPGYDYIFEGDVGRICKDVEPGAYQAHCSFPGCSYLHVDVDALEILKEDRDPRQPQVNNVVVAKSEISITDLHALKSSGFTTDEIIKLKEAGLL